MAMRTVLTTNETISRKATPKTMATEKETHHAPNPTSPHSAWASPPKWCSSNPATLRTPRRATKIKHDDGNRRSPSSSSLDRKWLLHDLRDVAAAAYHPYEGLHLADHPLLRVLLISVNRSKDHHGQHQERRQRKRGISTPVHAAKRGTLSQTIPQTSVWQSPTNRSVRS